MEQAFLPKHVRCEYNQQGPCCSYALATRYFHEGEVQFVFCLLIFMKQRIGFRFHTLQERVLRWTKPPTTSLLLDTLADLAGGNRN